MPHGNSNKIFLLCLFLFSTCFGRLCAHHQEKQLYLFLFSTCFGWLCAHHQEKQLYLFLFSTCFGRLCAHHQEKQLYLCDAWYLLLCMDDRLVCKVEWNCSRIFNILVFSISRWGWRIAEVEWWDLRPSCVGKFAEDGTEYKKMHGMLT